MTICRALPLVAALTVLPSIALAQFGGMPGMPGSPGMPGGAFGAPSAPPPACQELLTLRDDVQKHALAIQNANKRHESPVVACKLFRAFMASDSKMIKAVEQNGPTCGVPANVPQQMKASHADVQKIAKQVCDAAAQGGRPPAPSLSEAFSSTPILPNESKKERGGAFDTLTGSALAR
jgi:hypothetical protein